MSEKTEQPTPKRLRDAREKGQVAKSQEVPSAAVVLTIVVYFLARGGSLASILLEMTDKIFSVAALPYDIALPQALSAVTSAFLRIVAPLVVLVIVVSVMSNLAQVGVMFSFKAAQPKLENLNPAQWFKKTFSKKNLFEFAKNIVKVAVLTVAVKLVLTSHWRELFLISLGDVNMMWRILGSMNSDLLLYASAAFAVLAVFDFIYQKMKYLKDNMMSKDEVKREYKEMEGDPLIKSKRKQLHQEMASQNAMAGVRKAKVLITNPTHVAVALDYEEGKTPLPIIMAKGEGELARRMIEVAKEAGVPIMRQAPLARALFADGEEFSFIPRDLIAPVAEILRWLKTLKN
ncbi:MAG: type III secretion system export apparatus subunit SctU [Deltaproteobacteria bacterium]|jgi:type III secretion protein U|nr:type III secretion system export apparatus subunit SctU [Deltaproteobacteria bacterium]